jgi:hypothetical protein
MKQFSFRHTDNKQEYNITIIQKATAGYTNLESKLHAMQQKPEGKNQEDGRRLKGRTQPFNPARQISRQTSRA